MNGGSIITLGNTNTYAAPINLTAPSTFGGDTGTPIVMRKGEGEPFLELARNAVARTAEVAQQEGPKIEISD